MFTRAAPTAETTALPTKDVSMFTAPRGDTVAHAPTKET
jgi:hypothetical protein